VLVTAVLHGNFNAFGDGLMATKYLSGNPLIVTATGAVGLGVFAIAILITYAVSRRHVSLHRSGGAKVAFGRPQPSQEQAV
jgi:hypothetical protein